MESQPSPAPAAESPHAALPPVRRVRLPTMLAYGFGAVAYGVKDFGFLTFLLIFYNQVMGLPAEQVGFVIMLALLVDAVVDPLIGFLSDRTRSRWGRRHPWMYAAALPIAVAWLFLWNPPELSHNAMLVWVFVTAVAVRTTVSAYEVPSQALSPELTADYNERTRIMAYRYLFGWGGGMVMLMVSYGWFFAPGPGQPLGPLSRGGYPGFAIGGAVAMVVAILVSALGTHREIRNLPRADVERKPKGESFAEFRKTIANPAFLTLMGAGLCYFSAQGISFSLSQYLYSHVWRFGPWAYQMIGVVLIGGAVAACISAPRLARRIGKPRAAMFFMAGGAMLLVSPYVLRLLRLFPENDSPWMLPILFSIFFVNGLCSISSTILGASMLADVVEHSEVQTGRRSEGVFFAGFFFVQKCTSGVGIFLTGRILLLAGFPPNAVPGSLPVATIDRLTLLFVVAYLTLGFAAAAFYSRFPFGKAEHEARVAKLAGA
jgi:GPH family glycoside/pentoside/hexuronide:cation symporter